jgi:hypothetical protein
MKLAAYADLGVEVPPPVEHQGSTCPNADVYRLSKKEAIAVRAVARPALDMHVRKQLGLSLRIFYDAVLCGPLPDRFVELATKASRPTQGITSVDHSP